MLILKQHLWFYSHPGHCSLGGNPLMPCLASPPVIPLLPILNQPHHPSFHRYYMMTDYAFFSQGSDRWKELTSMWGCHPICPQLQQFHIASITQSEISSLTNLKAWGEKQKVHSDIAFLLILAKEDATGDRKYGLSTIWVNPHQARVHSMEEAVGELTVWVSSRPDWPYTLVWLNEDTCHAPLPREGHLGILPQGGTNMTACSKISQLEVCQLLVSGLQVAYLVGLNGHEDPIIISLSKSLANSTSLTGGRSAYLAINILLPLVEELDQKGLPLGRCSTILIASPLKATPPKLEREVSMTMEVRNLGWCQACLAAGQGTQPQKYQTLWSYLHLHPTSWGISPSQWTPCPRWAPRMMSRWWKPP